MLKCWREDPDLRPDFAELAECFGKLLPESVKEVNNICAYSALKQSVERAGVA